MSYVNLQGNQDEKNSPYAHLVAVSINTEKDRERNSSQDFDGQVQDQLRTPTNFEISLKQASTSQSGVNRPPKRQREGYDKITCKAVLTILGGWSVLLIIGAQLAWGNQSTYIASYYYMLGHDVHMNDFYIVQPLIVVIATIFFPLGMQASQAIGAKKVLIAGGLISLGMVYLCSYIQSPTTFIYCYSCAFGIGKALMYSAALQAGWSHLQERIGLVSGLIICGFGFGGFFFGIIMNLLCNPDNIEVQKFMIDGKEEQLFPTEVAQNVPAMLRTLDLIWSGLFLFGACTVQTYQPPLDIELDDQVNLDIRITTTEEELLNANQRATYEADQAQEDDGENNRRLKNQEKSAEENLPLWDVLKTYKFGMLYCMVVCHMFYGYYMSNQFKQYGFTGGLDDKTLTMIGSCGALFNGCFKIFWATLLDYYNFKRIYSVILVIQISMLIAVHWAVNNAGTYAIVICLSFMCDGSITSMIPVVTNHVFGVKRGPSVYGYMFSTFGVAAMLGTLLVKTCQDPLGYTGMLLICLGFTICSAVIAMFYQFQPISYLDLAKRLGYEVEQLGNTMKRGETARILDSPKESSSK